MSGVLDHGRTADTVGQTTAAAVANEFLQLEKHDPGHPPIDQMKIQKLAYYAHAWSLAVRDKPLFDEDIEAWPWGPVVRNLYFSFRKFGRDPIREPATEPRRVGPGWLDVRFVVPSVTDGPDRDFVRAVWDSHKALTGIQLSNATHAPGEPWTIIRDLYGSLEGKPTIPNDLIRSTFKYKLDSARADTAASR